MKPVAYQTIHDAGFQVYSQTLAIRPEDLETLRPCLERFVPVVQQSALDFIADPARTNAAIVDIVEQYDTFWTYTPELAEYSVQTQLELGLTGNGPDETLGNITQTLAMSYEALADFFTEAATRTQCTVFWAA